MKKYDHIKKQLDSSQAIDKQIKGLQKQQETISAKITQEVFELIKPIYKQWRPMLNEQAFYIDFMGQIYFRLRVKSINGIYVRTQADCPNHTAYYNFELDLASYENDCPRFIVPQQLFEELNTSFILKEIYC